MNSGAETAYFYIVSAPEFHIVLFPNLLQLPRLRIDDEPAHNNVLRYERVGLVAFLRHEGFVESDNLVDHNLSFFKFSAKIEKNKRKLKPISCKYKKMYLCSTIQKSEEDAIYQTMEDRDELACIIMDISPDANLDRFFRPLENNRSSEMILGKEKGRPHRRSWLRLYAIKLSVGIYIITGGAIKLTRTMQEREHTLQELEKMEKVRNFLVREHVFDEDSFTDYQQEVEL